MRSRWIAPYSRNKTKQKIVIGQQITTLSTNIEKHSTPKIQSFPESENTISGKIVVLSSDTNPEYSFFVPITSLLWTKIGYSPFVLLAGEEKYWAESSIGKLIINLTEKFGGVIRFIGSVEGYKTSTVAQAARLYGAALDFSSDIYLLTSDMDMWPLSKQWFNQQDFSRLALFYANAYIQEDGNVSQYPMCYIGATVGKWRDIMNIGTEGINKILQDRLDNELGREASAGEAWNHDEKIFYRYLLKWKGFPVECHMINRRGGPPVDRIDRGDWPKNLSISNKVDSHLLRPGYNDNWSQLRSILNQLVPSDILSVCDEYRETFIGLVK